MTTFACCRFSGKHAQGSGMHPSRVWLELYFRVRLNVEFLVFIRPEVWSAILGGLRQRTSRIKAFACLFASVLAANVAAFP
jgi:hypothetical protein